MFAKLNNCSSYLIISKIQILYRRKKIDFFFQSAKAFLYKKGDAAGFLDPFHRPFSRILFYLFISMVL